MILSIMAVSYTHLDVYKRQLLCIVLLQVLWSVYKLPVVRNFCSYVNHPTENLRGRSPLYIACLLYTS